MLYAKIREGKIIKVGNRPNWKDDDGNLVGDKILRKNGYFPVYMKQKMPKVDEFYQSAILKQYEEWEITDDCVYATYKVEEQSVDQIRNKVERKLKAYISKKYRDGLVSNTINEKINSSLIDLTKMKNLLDYLNDKNQDIIDFRVFDNSIVSITKNQLQQMISELNEYHIDILNEKWNIEQRIKEASTIEDLKTIFEELGQ